MNEFVPIKLASDRSYKVDRFDVIGERGSGTNFVRNMVSSTFDIKYTNGFGWKHGFMSVPSVPRQMLTIVVVRHAVHWLKSLYMRPHYGYENLDLNFSEFIRSPWNTVHTGAYHERYLRRYYAPCLGMPNFADRDPMTLQPFENPMKLRNAKLAFHLNLAEVLPNIVIVRYEDVNGKPRKFIKLLRQEFKIKQVQAYEPTDEKFGHFGETDPERQSQVEKISREDKRFIISQLDRKQELLCRYEYKKPKHQFISRHLQSRL